MPRPFNRRQALESRAFLAALRRTGNVHLEPDRPALPALEQVTGWSGAGPEKPPHHSGRALFGGWRLKDWRGRK